MIATWRRPLTQASLLLMEALWSYALVAFFVALTVGGGRPTVFGVACIVFASFGMSRLLQSTTMSLGPLRVWGTLLSFILFYAIVRVDFFGDWRFWDFSWADSLFNHTDATLRDKANAVIAIPVLWLLWMRGVIRGQRSLIFEEVVNSFAIGIVIIGFVELFGPAVHAPGSVGAVAVPYIAVGLLTIAFAHAMRSEGEFGKSFGGTWLAAVGGAIILIALVSLVFVILDLGTMKDALQSASLATTKALFHFFSFLAWPFEQFINGLYKGLYWFFHNVFGGQKPDRQLQQANEATPTPDPNAKPPGAPPHWLDLLVRIGFGSAFVVTLLFLSWVMFMRFAKRKDPGELKESTYSEGRFAADLGNMFGSMLGRLRPNLRLGGEQQEPIHRLYFDMLSTAADRGVERRPPETPNELSPRLEQTFRVDVPTRITSSFTDSRYGGLTLSESDVKRLREEWDQGKR